MVRMLIVRLLLVALVLIAVVVPTVPAAAAGKDPFGGIDCSKAHDAAVCQPTAADPLTTTNGVLHKLTTLVAIIAGAAAVIVMVAAGITYISSQGDPEKTKKAKNAILYAVAGLVIIVLGQAIINFVIGKV
jgi:hypothetical protein